MFDIKLHLLTLNSTLASLFVVFFALLVVSLASPAMCSKQTKRRRRRGRKKMRKFFMDKIESRITNSLAGLLAKLTEVHRIHTAIPIMLVMQLSNMRSEPWAMRSQRCKHGCSAFGRQTLREDDLKFDKQVTLVVRVLRLGHTLPAHFHHRARCDDVTLGAIDHKVALIQMGQAQLLLNLIQTNK
jgi:hypothetical protein